MVIENIRIVIKRLRDKKLLVLVSNIIKIYKDYILKSVLYLTKETSYEFVLKVEKNDFYKGEF